MTVLGTRPEIIRLSLLIPLLDEFTDHVLVHTGQNFDERLSPIFFRDLDVREPDVHLSAGGGSFGQQMGGMLAKGERALIEHKPDRLLVLGDTNSALLAVVAKRLGIPVYHMEAGNRCYDDRVPEEVNRRIIDHCSDVLMPYTERSRANLLREGVPGHRIFVTGNPICEVLKHYRPRIEASDALGRLGLAAGKFFLVTMHRAENVDVPSRLQSLLDGLNRVADAYQMPVLCSLHPHTRARLEQGRTPVGAVRMVEPLGFFDFVNLEKNAYGVISDSGTVQEECCIMQTPNVTIRDTTERPETLEAGSNVLVGGEPQTLLDGVRVALSCRRSWEVPREYLAENVSDTVLKILISYTRPAVP